MNAIIAFLQGHGLMALIAGFTVLSILLDAAAKVLAALGKKAPGWLGSVANVVSQILHFLNGNVSAVAPAPAASSNPAQQASGS